MSQPSLRAASSDVLEAKGLLIPFQEVTLGSQDRGIIQMIKPEGTRIEANDVVVEFEHSIETLNVQQNEKMVEKRDFEKKSAEKLQESQGVSQNELLEARVQYEIARLGLEAARAQLARKTLHSPIPGVITKLIKQQGEVVDLYSPVMTIVNLQQVYLETHLPAAYIHRVSQDQSVDVFVSAYPKETFRGKLSFIAPVIDAASNEFRVKILLDNASGRLRPGMTASARITPQPAQD